MRRSSLLAASACCLIWGCKSSPQEAAQAASASPQASAEPAPIAAQLVASAGTSPDSGPPPAPLRGDRALDAENTGKDSAGYTLSVVLRLPDAPAISSGPGVNTQAIDAIRKQNEPRFEIDLSPSRMRMQLSSTGFLLPVDSEIRARLDRYGHLLVGGDGLSYHALAPGALRALVAERRTDVSPLSPAEVTSAGAGLKRLGYPTRKVEISDRAAKATLELARLPELGEGGALLVRVLLDLMSAAPSTPVTAADEVPLHAELRWSTRGAIFFDVTSVAKRTDLSAQQLAVPPTTARFVEGPLPFVAGELRVSEKDLATIHTGPTDVGPGAAAGVTSGVLTLINAHDTPRIAWVDGAPIAWVAPEGRLDVGPLPRGHYQVEWRTFLDDSGDPSKTVTVPNVPNAKDAGAP